MNAGLTAFFSDAKFGIQFSEAFGSHVEGSVLGELLVMGEAKQVVTDLVKVVG